MASSVIHMCIASEVNKYLKKDDKGILIGSIAPDISKHIKQTKEFSHFLDNVDNNVPNIEKFLNKYKNNLYDSFVMGYYIHLYTDYLWFKFFMPNFVKKDFIYDLNNNKIYLSEKDKLQYIYNDYTNSITEPIAIGGATYARAFNNFVSFGANLPNQKDLCHQTDEFISIDNLLSACEIYCSTIFKLLYK